MSQMLPRDTTGTATESPVRIELADPEGDLLREDTTAGRRCEEGCGCRYGTDDADRMECGCDGPCTEGGDDWYETPR